MNFGDLLNENTEVEDIFQIFVWTFYYIDKLKIIRKITLLIQVIEYCVRHHFRTIASVFFLHDLYQRISPLYFQIDFGGNSLDVCLHRVGTKTV